MRDIRYFVTAIWWSNGALNNGGLGSCECHYTMYFTDAWKINLKFKVN